MCQPYQCKFHIILDSNLYIFGGVNPLSLPPHWVIALTSPPNPVTTIINFYSREVLSLDLNHPLIVLRSMVGIGDINIPRCSPHTTVLDGKIYVWDGFWYYIGSVGWMLRLRWATSGGGRPIKWIQNQKGGRSEPTKHPPTAKLVSQRLNSNLFRKSSVPEIFLFLVLFRPVLYIGILGRLFPQ